MNNWFKTSFDQLLSRLNKPYIKVISSDMRYQSNSELKEDNSFFKGLNSRIREFYAETEYANCKWAIVESNTQINYRDKELDIIGGEFQIPSLMQLKTWKEEGEIEKILNPFSAFPENVKKELNNYVPFDIVKSEFAVCLKYDNSGIADELHLVDYSDKIVIIPLRIGTEEYLKQGFSCSFFYGWQKAFLLNDQPIKEKIEFYLKQLF